MEPAADLADLLHGPPGRYFADRTWIEFCTLDGVAGFVLWGRPGEEDARNFMRILAPAGSPLAEKRPRYFDVRRLDTPDTQAFEVFAERLVQHAPLLSELVSRVAVVHKGGLSGALVEGFGSVAFLPFPVSFFVDAAQALAWLGAPDPLALAGELDALHARATGTTQILRDVRALLQSRLQHRPREPARIALSLAEASSALGVSTRALQRHLQDHGTSYQEERARARVEAAKRLLVDTDATVEQIAYEVGCASVRHFSALFRERMGETPARWREAARKG